MSFFEYSDTVKIPEAFRIILGMSRRKRSKYPFPTVSGIRYGIKSWIVTMVGISESKSKPIPF